MCIIVCNQGAGKKQEATQVGQNNWVGRTEGGSKSSTRRHCTGKSWLSDVHLSWWVISEKLDDQLRSKNGNQAGIESELNIPWKNAPIAQVGVHVQLDSFFNTFLTPPTGNLKQIFLLVCLFIDEMVKTKWMTLYWTTVLQFETFNNILFIHQKLFETLN